MAEIMPRLAEHQPAVGSNSDIIWAWAFGILILLTVGLFVVLLCQWKNCAIQTDDEGISVFGWSGRVVSRILWADVTDVALNEKAHRPTTVEVKSHSGKIDIQASVENVGELLRIVRLAADK